jgi:hypothetical protein
MAARLWLSWRVNQQAILKVSKALRPLVAVHRQITTRRQSSTMLCNAWTISNWQNSQICTSTRPAPAAIAAAYAPRSASVTSCRLLRNAKVQAEVLVWKALTDVVAAAKPDTLLHWYRAGYLRLPQYFCLQKVLALAISTVHTPRNIPPKPKGIRSPSTKIAQHEDRPARRSTGTI